MYYSIIYFFKRIVTKYIQVKKSIGTIFINIYDPRGNIM